MAIKDIRESLKRFKEADPIELAGQVNDWFHESAESLREKIEDEVEKAVAKRGFVKKSDFAKLEARIAVLEGKSKSAKSVKKSTGKSVKKPVAKKAAAAKKKVK